MLYYSPQVWCSDDTDAIERLSIQEGTALLYPLSAIGAHVSDCPNHITGRTVPFQTRGHIALAGTFGYEHYQNTGSRPGTDPRAGGMVSQVQ